jgi:hypothetical protein
MDKASERKKDTKKHDGSDKDIACRDYGAGGKNDMMAGLWSIVDKDVVGLGPERLLTNCYGKECDTREKPDLLDEMLINGPPLLNVSKPRRVF